MNEITAKTPWEGHTEDIPLHLDYFQGSMVDAINASAEKYPNSTAFSFMGKATSYRTMIQEIERCARALRTIGVRENDRVTIALPNCPQAVYMFYAVNQIGRAHV